MQQALSNHTLIVIARWFGLALTAGLLVWQQRTTDMWVVWLILVGVTTCLSLVVQPFTRVAVRQPLVLSIDALIGAVVVVWSDPWNSSFIPFVLSLSGAPCRGEWLARCSDDRVAFFGSECRVHSDQRWCVRYRNSPFVGAMARDWCGAGTLWYDITMVDSTAQDDVVHAACAYPHPGHVAKFARHSASSTRTMATWRPTPSEFVVTDSNRVAR